MDTVSLTWWMWILLGLALLMFEIVTPGGFFVFFFGIGALLVGLLAAPGILNGLVAQGIAFVAISVISLLLLRKRLQENFQRRIPQHKVDSLVGQIAVAVDEVPPGKEGQAEMRGTVWGIRNIGDLTIARSQRCRVEQVEGLRLHVRGEA